MGGPAYIDGKEYKEFDNFYRAPIIYGPYEDKQPWLWPTVEHAFQSQKCVNNGQRHEEKLKYWNKLLEKEDPLDARALGQDIKLRADWEDVKHIVMLNAVQAKLIQYPGIYQLLMNTRTIDRADPDIIFKGSTEEWNKINSRIWNFWRCNRLSCEVGQIAV